MHGRSYKQIFVWLNNMYSLGASHLRADICHIIQWLATFKCISYGINCIFNSQWQTVQILQATYVAVGVYYPSIVHPDLDQHCRPKALFYTLISENHEMSQHLRFWFLSHWRATKAQTSLLI